MNMRILKSVITLLVAVALLSAGTACAPEQTPATTPTPTPQETPTPTPDDPEPPEPRDLTLRVGTTKDFKTTSKFADYWYGVLSNLTTHDSLIKLGPDMLPTPWLASDWTISDDSMTFTFTIAENAT